MVQFGKTLNEVVKTEWKCYAVAYIELKRALTNRGDHNIAVGCVKKGCGVSGVNGCIDPANPGTNADDGNGDAHSVHTESSYSISDTQKANFFRIFDDSIIRLGNFYDDRVDWARQTGGALHRQVQELVGGPGIRATIEEGSSDTLECSNKSVKAEPLTGEEGPSSVSYLILRLTNFSRELGLVTEFLELNATAFSKILKKYDKRTGSILREEKLNELKSELPFINDGGELKKYKKLTAEWLQALDLKLSSKSKKSVISVRPEPTIDTDENPQCSDSSVTKSIDTLDSSVRRGKDVHHVYPPPRGGRHVIHETKESKVLRRIMDKVNRELDSQQANSPFFANLPDRSPPSFMTSEVQIQDEKELGHGEFCQIFEVKAFRVPESCHICFLHRGFNDPEPSSLNVPNTHDGPNTIESATAFVKAPIPKPDCNGSNDSDNPKNKPPAPVTDIVPAHHDGERQSAENIKSISCFSFSFDANISDYGELEDDHEDDGYDHETRGFMKDHCLRNGEARYAVKRIRSDLVGEESITDAAGDLAREALFLAALSHPNIIKIRGTSNVPGHPKYSLILDRLYDTLEVQIDKWRMNVKKYRGKFMGLIGKKKTLLKDIWMSRVLTAYDIAQAMKYLHNHGILHRDIKPANIGFDIRGDVKLFDFGLSKELKPINCVGQDQYHTSGLAGTRRYMSPEVAQVKPYGLSSDVYSFGILMWEMLTLKPAYENYTRDRHFREVVVEGKRPKICKSWPFAVKNLLERSWAPNPPDRPSFQAVCELIKFALPDEKLGSERSGDLMLRSIRSISGDGDNIESGHIIEFDNLSEVKLSEVPEAR